MKLRDRHIFFSGLAVLLDAGVRLDRALEVLAGRAEGEQKKRIDAMIKWLSRGGTLSEAMREAGGFTVLDEAIVEAAELGDYLEEAVSDLARSLERGYSYKLMFRAETVYYTIVTVIGFVMLNLIFYLFVFVSDTIGYNNANSSMWLVPVATWLLAMPLLGWAILSALRPRLRDKIVLVAPLLDKRTLMADLASFARGAAAALKAGINLPESTALAASGVSNSALRAKLSSLKRPLEKGAALDELIPRLLLVPDFISSLVGVAGRDGDLPKAFIESAEYYENGLDKGGYSIFRITAVLMVLLVIGTAVMLFLGVNSFFRGWLIL